MPTDARHPVWGAAPRPRLAAFALALALAAGCAPPPPQPADPEAARRALDRALTAWAAGKGPDALRDEDPPLIASDHRWREGYRLERFAIEPGDRPQGANRMIRATLWERDPRGRPARETVEYTVGTGSPLTVHRDDL